MFFRRTPNITVNELNDRLDSESKNLFLIDIRRPDEWVQTGVISGSELITGDTLKQGMESGKFKDKFDGKEVVIICRSGMRSGRMTRYLLKQEGLNSNILNMKGGINTWKKNGYKVEFPVK